MSFQMQNRTVSDRRSLTNQLSDLESKSHIWEETITRVNCQVMRLRELGVLHSSIVLGPLLMSRPYGTEGPSDSGEVIQAAICSDSGLVAVFWDTEDLHGSDRLPQETVELDASERATPIAECGPAIRWLVAQHAEALMQSLTEAVKIAN